MLLRSITVVPRQAFAPQRGMSTFELAEAALAAYNNNNKDSSGSSASSSSSRRDPEDPEHPDHSGGGGGGAAAAARTSVGGVSFKWPRPKVNLGLNVCHQNETHVIERLGRFNRVQESGLYVAIPMMDKVVCVVDKREKAIQVSPQSAVTMDNVKVAISGIVCVQFENPHDAMYGHFNPMFAVEQHAQSVMRAAIGSMQLDELFHNRGKVNSSITQGIGEAARKWGLRVLRYEITGIVPDARISEAMDKQAAAERIRREQVLQAEGQKQSAVLRSEGELIRRTNEAEANRLELEKAATGKAFAITAEANAQKGAIDKISAAIQQPSGQIAAQLGLADGYYKMMGDIGSKSNTMFFGQQTDMTSMMASLASAFQVASSASSSPPNSSPSDSVGAIGHLSHYDGYGSKALLSEAEAKANARYLKERIATARKACP